MYKIRDWIANTNFKSHDEVNVSEEINDYSKYGVIRQRAPSRVRYSGENPDKINWKILSNNKSNWAIDFTAEPRQNRIVRVVEQQNPEAIKLLKERLRSLEEKYSRKSLGDTISSLIGCLFNHCHNTYLTKVNWGCCR
jgi:hypothetical protein